EARRVRVELFPADGVGVHRTQPEIQRRGIGPRRVRQQRRQPLLDASIGLEKGEQANALLDERALWECREVHRRALARGCDVTGGVGEHEEGLLAALVEEGNDGAVHDGFACLAMMACRSASASAAPSSYALLYVLGSGAEGGRDRSASCCPT